MFDNLLQHVLLCGLRDICSPWDLARVRGQEPQLFFNVSRRPRAAKMYNLKPDIDQYKGYLQSLLYLRPELESPIKYVARVVSFLDVYRQLYEQQEYVKLCSFMRVEDDYDKYAVHVANHVAKLQRHPRTSSEHKMFLTILWGVCRECLEKAFKLYTRADSSMVAFGSAVPLNAELALYELERAERSLWTFQFAFHMAQARRYGLDSLKVLPSPKTSPMKLDSPVKSDVTMTSPPLPLTVPESAPAGKRKRSDLDIWPPRKRARHNKDNLQTIFEEFPTWRRRRQGRPLLQRINKLVPPRGQTRTRVNRDTILRGVLRSKGQLKLPKTSPENREFFTKTSQEGAPH